MSKSDSPHHGVFSNKPEGAYYGNVWDMATVLKRRAYTIKETESNRKSVEPGDAVFIPFVKETQPEMWKSLEKLHGAETE